VVAPPLVLLSVVRKTVAALTDGLRFHIIAYASSLGFNMELSTYVTAPLQARKKKGLFRLSALWARTAEIACARV